jgi:hypothetical protein
LITRIDGSESDGPAKRSASAGPWPIPAPKSPWTIGISVSVAKYMSAPAKAAKKLAKSELPPRRPPIQDAGINASWPGRPRRKPATRTPPNRSGSICREKSRVATTHSARSSRLNHRRGYRRGQPRSPR